MNSTGIARKVDDLGRIVLPVELRRAFGIRVGDELTISVEGDRIVLTPAGHHCVFCGGDEGLRPFRGREVCTDCASALAS